MTFTTKDLIQIVGVVLSLAGLYYGLAAKIDRQAELIQDLNAKAAAQALQLHDEERALIELTITLRTKEIIK